MYYTEAWFVFFFRKMHILVTGLVLIALHVACNGAPWNLSPVLFADIAKEKYYQVYKRQGKGFKIGPDGSVKGLKGWTRLIRLIKAGWCSVW